jgi:hypothetical protein
MSINTPAPIPNPTWYTDIRQMFTDIDIDHMAKQGLDLTSYEQVSASAGGIYGQVATGAMPPGNPWPKGRVDTFLTWMSNGYPKGMPAPEPIESRSVAPRIRKDVESLSSNEISLLKMAFQGIMDKAPDDPNSYFVQAGYHWLPGPALYCQHHVPGYNPWHRAYLMSFEDALRSVPGCESVTLPYWDILKVFPDLLNEKPFDAYTLPMDIGQGFAKGYKTERFPYQEIQQNLKIYDVAGHIRRAMSKTDWEDFHGWWSGAANDTIVAAHDNGHGAIGPTVQNQSVASFEPSFWFFHANWDRLWWEWQKAVGGTSLNGLLTTIDKQNDLLSYQLFTVPALQKLEPFSSLPVGLDSVKVIDSVGSLGVDYAHPEGPSIPFGFEKKSRLSVSLDRNITINPLRAKVTVDGLNRLKIPGSFAVHLFKEKERLASHFLFQPNEADKCETCVKNAIARFDFDLPLSDLAGGILHVQVEPVDKSFVGERFPIKLMGTPTISVHVPLQTD